MIFSFFCLLFIIFEVRGKSINLNPYADEGLTFLQPISTEKAEDQICKFFNLMRPITWNI